MRVFVHVCLYAGEGCYSCVLQMLDCCHVVLYRWIAGHNGAASGKARIAAAGFVSTKRGAPFVNPSACRQARLVVAITLRNHVDNGADVDNVALS